jgi:ABC-2 type transport system permease protein
MKRLFSLARLWAIFVKEFQQMMRDRPTFAMAVGVPIIQLVLFGYAINTDPKGLPTAVVSHDSGPLARSLLATLENTGYFHHPPARQRGRGRRAGGRWRGAVPFRDPR